MNWAKPGAVSPFFSKKIVCFLGIKAEIHQTGLFL